MAEKQTSKLTFIFSRILPILVCVFVFGTIMGNVYNSKTAFASFSDSCAIDWELTASDLRVDKNVVHPSEKFFVYVKVSYINSELQNYCSINKPYFQLLYSINNGEQQSTNKALPAVQLNNGNPVALHYKFLLNAESLVGQISNGTLTLSAQAVSEKGNSKSLGKKVEVKVDSSKPAPNPITDQLPDIYGMRTGTVLQSVTPPTKNPTIMQSSGFVAPIVDALYSFLQRVIIFITGVYIRVIALAFFLFIVPVLSALLNIRAYSDDFVNVIYPGWLILRNFANIAFIAALLMMGLKILFQQEDSAKTRPFLIKLIVMALLVNFSLTIAQGIVAIGDTFQAQFLPKDSYVIQTIGKKLMLDPQLKLNAGLVGSDQATLPVETQAADLIRPAVLLFLSICAFFCFIALIAFVFIRLVALWVLYMLSPVAYFAAVMPQTSQIADQWWKEFIKYVIMVPVLAFFLNIAAMLSDLFSQTDTTPKLKMLNDALSGFSTDLVNFALTVITFFIPLIFIVLGMKYALDSGTFGAKEVVGAAKKGVGFLAQTVPKLVGQKVGDYASDKASKAGYDKLSTAAAIVSHPKVFKDEVKKSWKNAREEREERMGGRMRNIPLLTRSKTPPKLGNDTVAEREYAKKHFDSDTSAGYQSSILRDSLENKDRLAFGAMALSMGKNKNPKEFLQTLGKQLHNDENYYAQDKTGLNKATKDLVDNGMLTDGKRTDILHNFDESLKGDKDKAHFTGNVAYNEVTKKHEVKPLAVKEHESDPDRLGMGVDVNGNPIDYEKEWEKKQINKRKKGLGEDLKEAADEATVYAYKDEDNNTKLRLTKTMYGVLAEQTAGVLGSKSVARKAQRDNPAKIRKLKEGFNRDDALEAMTEHYQNNDIGKGMNAADIKTAVEKKINRIESVLLVEQDDPDDWDDDNDRKRKGKGKGKKDKDDNDSGKSVGGNSGGGNSGGGGSGGGAGGGGGGGLVDQYGNAARSERSTINNDPRQRRSPQGQSIDPNKGSGGGSTNAVSNTIVTPTTGPNPSGASSQNSTIIASGSGVASQTASIIAAAAQATRSGTSSAAPTKNVTIIAGGGGGSSSSKSTYGNEYLEQEQRVPELRNDGFIESVNNQTESNSNVFGKVENNPSGNPSTPTSKENSTIYTGDPTIGFNAGRSEAQPSQPTGTLQTAPGSSSASNTSKPLGSITPKISSYSPASNNVFNDIKVDGQMPNEVIVKKERVSIDPNTGAIEKNPKAGGNIQIRERKGKTEALPNYNYIDRPEDYQKLSKIYKFPLSSSSTGKYLKIVKPATFKSVNGNYELHDKGIIELSDTPPTQ